MKGQAWGSEGKNRYRRSAPMIAFVLVALIAVSLSSLIIIPTAKAQASAPPNTSLLTLQGKDTSGSVIYGYLFEIIDQSGNVLADMPQTSSTPWSFRLNNSQTYTLSTSPVAISANFSTNSHFVACDFDYWSDTGDTSVARTISITSNTNITVLYTCPSSITTTTPTITVSTVDLAGNTIAGYYVVLYDQSGTSILTTGFSPASFTLNDGQTYTVQVDDYGPCHFDYWADTGSTNPERTVSISSSTQLTAVYDCVQSTISVSTTTSAGTPLMGYYATLFLSDGAQIGSCFSACSFTVDNGQDYVVTVANYGDEMFTNWSDGDGIMYAWGGSHYVALPEGDTSVTISLTAVYSP